MPSTIAKRDIIDRKALVIALNEATKLTRPEAYKHGKILTLFKDAREKGWKEIRFKFQEGGISAIDAIAANSYLVELLSFV